MITAKNIQFYYKKKQPYFSFPDIQLQDNEHLLILGKSGIGKTTLLHLLAGLLSPKSGSIVIEKTDITTLSSNQLDVFRGQHIGLVFQKNHAIHSLSVIENLQARLFFSKKKIDKNAIEEMLKELDLLEVKNQKITQLSQGQLQRLGIAMSVIHSPKVILADEPTSSLDDENCRIVIELLKQQAKSNKANLIVITHDQRVKSSFTNTVTL